MTTATSPPPKPKAKKAPKPLKSPSRREEAKDFLRALRDATTAPDPAQMRAAARAHFGAQPDWLLGFAMEGLDSALYQLCLEVLQEARRAKPGFVLRKGGSTTHIPHDEVEEGAAALAARGLFFNRPFHVPARGTHLRLGAMTAPDLRDAIAYQRAQIGGVAWNVALMEAVLPRLPDDRTTVAEALSDAEAAALEQTVDGRPMVFVATAPRDGDAGGGGVDASGIGGNTPGTWGAPATPQAASPAD